MQRCCASNGGLTNGRLEALRTVVAVVDHEGFASTSWTLRQAQLLGVWLLRRTA
jgi:hypothetical protein